MKNCIIFATKKSHLDFNLTFHLKLKYFWRVYRQNDIEVEVEVNFRFLYTKNVQFFMENKYQNCGRLLRVDSVAGCALQDF